MEKIVHNHEFHVYVTSRNCQNSYHKLCQYKNIQKTNSEQISQVAFTCSKLTMETPEQYVFHKQISHIVLVFSFLTLNK